MHPLIAFLSFIFSPADDWALKKGFSLILNPYDVPAVVEMYNDFRKKYPSDTKEKPEPASVDEQTMVLWAEALKNQGFATEASLVLKKTLKRSKNLNNDLADDIKIRIGEVALKDGRIEEATQFFTEVADRGGARSLDAQINLLITDLSQKNLEAAEARSQTLYSLLGADITYKRALLPMGLMAYAKGQYDEAVHHLAKMEGDDRANYFEALAHRHQSRPHQALAKWQEIRKRNGDSSWSEMAQFQIAETYFYLGDENLSRKVCEEALAKNTQSPMRNKFVFRLASIDVGQGNYDAAIDRLAKIPEFGDLTDRALVLTAESLAKTNTSSDLIEKMAKRKTKDADVKTLYQTAWAALFDSRVERSMEVSQTGLEDFYHDEYTPRLLLLQGLAYEYQEKPADALATYQIVADQFHNTSAATKAIHWTLLSYLRLGRYREAVTHTGHLWNRQSEETRANYPDPAFWLAEAHLNLKRFNDADDNYQDFLGWAPHKHDLIPYAQFQRSVALAKQDRTDEAMAMLDEFTHTANKQEQESWVQLAHMQKGHILFNNRNFEQAVAHYRASDRRPKALYYEGVALSRMDYYLDAVDVWTKLAQNHPESSFAQTGLFKAGRTQFELGHATQAAATFAYFRQTYPDNPQVKDALLQSAHALFNVNLATEAAPLYAEYLANYRTTLDLTSVTPFLASAYIQMGKPAAEIEELMRGLPRNEALADLTWEQGATKYNEQKYDEATQLFGYLLAGYPTSENSGKAMFYRGESYFQTGDWFSALNAYNNYLHSVPKEELENGALAMFRRSVAHYNQNQLYHAAKSFEDLLENYPDDELAAQAKQNLALCYYNLGDWDTMNTMKTKYNIPDPDQPEAQPVTEKPANVAKKRRVYEAPGFQVHIKEKKESEMASHTPGSENDNLDGQ